MFERVAEAGVGIDHQRARKRLADRRHVVGELGQRDQPVVGDAEKGVGDAGAGDIGGRKAQIGHHARRQRVADARQQQRRRRAEHGAKFAAGYMACHRSIPFDSAR